MDMPQFLNWYKVDIKFVPILIFLLLDEDNIDENEIDENNDVVRPGPKEIVSLTNVCDDDDINMDAKFVDDLSALMKSHQTSKLFTPFMAQLKSVQQRSRRSLKKRIDQNLKVRFGISISL